MKYKVLSLLYIVIVLLHYSYSFQHIHGKRSNSLSSILSSSPSSSTSIWSSPISTSSSVTSLSDISNLVNKNINTCLGNVASTITNLKLLERPGFHYALGCNEWVSSGYKGTLASWNANRYIDWLATSHIVYTDDESGLLADGIKEQIDISLFMTPDSSIPHIEMTIASTIDRYILHLDYTPRKELISDLEYFDTYFDGLEKEINDVINDGVSSKSLLLSTSQSSVLSKMLKSPFALDLIIPLNKDSMTIIGNLCEIYLNRWCKWMLAVKDTKSELEKLLLYKRDSQLRKLQYDLMRFNFALILGADFAPKAEDISSGMIGPSFSQLQ